MSYSYQAPLSYGNHQPLSYYEPRPVQPQMQAQPQIQAQPQYSSAGKKPSAAPAVILGSATGLIGGSLIAANQHPYIKNGVPTDKFAQKSYEKYMKNAPAAEKESYGQFKEVLKKIDKVKTTDELKTLINNNPKASEEISTALEKTTDEFLSTITDANLSSNKETIKKKLEAGNATRFQSMKNQIATCWDSAKKKLVKPDSMDETTFKAIKKSANSIKSGFIGIVAVSAAVTAGILGYVAHKISVNKKNS